MTESQLSYYRNLPFGAKLAYLVQIREARDYREALALINARRALYRQQVQDRAARREREAQDRARAQTGDYL